MIDLAILTFSELIELLEIINSLVCVKDENQFMSAACSLKELVECEYLIFGQPNLNSDEAQAVNDLNFNYPKSWVDLYQANQFWRFDPVVLATKERCSPQHWSDVYRRFPTDKKFVELAYDFGLKDGCSCLARSSTGCHWTMISVAGDFKKNKNRVGVILDRLTPYFNLALESLSVNFETQKLHCLTKREHEVIKWLSQGKTSWEISVILKMAESTVNFHVKNIMRKLDASSRGHAVAVAIQAGMLSMTV